MSAPEELERGSSFVQVEPCLLAASSEVDSRAHSLSFCWQNTAGRTATEVSWIDCGKSTLLLDYTKAGTRGLICEFRKHLARDGAKRTAPSRHRQLDPESYSSRTYWEQSLKQRTYARAGVERPSWAKANQAWWYTHIRLRRVQGLYRQLLRDRSLFTWLDERFHTEGRPTVDRTTSRLAGWPNRAVKDLLRHHKGLTGAHATRAVDWLLNSLTEDPYDPWDLAQRHLRSAPRRSESAPGDEPAGLEIYGTSTTAEEGLWARCGWAGRP